jgi:hypothetical protein
MGKFAETIGIAFQIQDGIYFSLRGNSRTLCSYHTKLFGDSERHP